MSELIILLASLYVIGQLTYGFRVKYADIDAYRNQDSDSGSNNQEDDLPTVSLLIPARNETHAITNALHNALSLNYPRLEIIVLDDQSGDNTSEKIRSFAHDGIRFIEGKPLLEGWVGKNWANHQLASAASGEILVFCDTDVWLNTDGLYRLISYVKSSNVQAVSVIPKLLPESKIELLIFPILHWLLISSSYFKSSNYLSYGGLTVFEKEAYLRHGGYSKYFDKVLPELWTAKDFNRSSSLEFKTFRNNNFNFTFKKKPSSLFESRVRYLRPMYHGFPFIAAKHLLCTTTPLLILYLGKAWLYVAVALIYSLSLHQQTKYWWLIPITLPVVSIVELVALGLSFWNHWRNKVSWKERNISTEVTAQST
ncbi:MAG: glycosyltransferase [Candidatus Saccharimonadales bacterium]